MKNEAEAKRYLKQWEREQNYELSRARMNAALDALLAWRKARPFLFDGQTVYARGLLLTILFSYRECCEISGELLCPKLIKRIRDLLHSGPPPRPPSPKALHPRGFSFSYKWSNLFLTLLRR